MVVRCPQSAWCHSSIPPLTPHLVRYVVAVPISCSSSRLAQHTGPRAGLARLVGGPKRNRYRSRADQACSASGGCLHGLLAARAPSTPSLAKAGQARAAASGTSLKVCTHWRCS